jgi:hypothetical protein
MGGTQRAYENRYPSPRSVTLRGSRVPTVADLNLVQAAPGTYALAPSSAMREGLARDHANMAAMVFGPILAFGDGMSSVAELERRLKPLTEAGMTKGCTTQCVRPPHPPKASSEARPPQPGRRS